MIYSLLLDGESGASGRCSESIRGAERLQESPGCSDAWIKPSKMMSVGAPTAVCSSAVLGGEGTVRGSSG